MKDNYITVAEAANILECSTSWVRALCRNGKLNTTGGGKQGKKWWIEKESLIELQNAVSIEDADPDSLDELADNIDDLASELADIEESKSTVEEKVEESLLETVLGKIKEFANKGGGFFAEAVSGVLAITGYENASIGVRLLASGIKEWAMKNRSKTLDE